MKAAHQKTYGAAGVLLVDDVLPRPNLRKGDLMVKVRYASLNPIDFHMRGGYGRQIMERKRDAV